VTHFWCQVVPSSAKLWIRWIRCRIPGCLFLINSLMVLAPEKMVPFEWPGPMEPHGAPWGLHGAHGTPMELPWGPKGVFLCPCSGHHHTADVIMQRTSSRSAAQRRLMCVDVRTSMGAHGTPMGPLGVPRGPMGTPWGLMGLSWSLCGAPCARKGPHTGARNYIHKLPIHRHRAAVTRTSCLYGMHVHARRVLQHAV